MHSGSRAGPVLVLLITLLISSPAILATATAYTGREGAPSHVDLDPDVLSVLPDTSDADISGEFFVSPLTDVRYLIRKNPEADRMWFCRMDDGVCYQSINEILVDESKNMPGWMLKVAPSLREQITGSISERGPQENEIRIIIELDDKHFHHAAEEVWKDRNNEIEEVMGGLADLGPSEGPAPNDLSGTLDRNLLDQLDLVLDDARSDIYILAEELTMPLVSRLTDQISTVGGVVVGHTPVLPAIFAIVPVGSIQTIALMDGVGRITEDGTMEAMMDVSAYAVGAGTWWTNGFTGGTWDLAVVDTGIDGSHPSLTVDFAQVFHAQGQGSGSYADNPTDPDDLLGHGTHIAGTVTSLDSTYQGVAYGMDALINAKAGYKRSGGGASMSWSDGMAAVDWAVNTAGADVISFSFGGGAGSGDTPYSRFYDAVADDLGVSVVLVVGNNGPSSTSIRNPGISFNAITVGSVDDKNTVTRSDDTIVSSSSRGPTLDGRLKPDILAPGQNIISTSSEWETGPDFESMSGTSMATPHVAAATLLLMDGMGAVFSLNYKALLLNSADDLGAAGPDYSHGWGYMNLQNAYNDRSQVFDDYVQDGGQGYTFFKGPVNAGDKGTIVWNRHVTYMGADFPVTYYGPNDLDLYAYNELNNLFVDSSLSAVNNVEQVVASTNFGSFVYKVRGQGTFIGLSQEHFAFASEGSVSPTTPPTLTPIVSAPGTVELGDTFWVTANVSNVGALTAHNVQATLNLPAGLSIVAGGNPITMGIITAASTEAASWQLKGDTIGLKSISVDLISNSYGEVFSFSSGGVSIDVVDTTEPTSYVDPLPAVQSLPAFTVTATAQDANIIVGVTLYYKRNGGSYTAYSADAAPPWNWGFDTSVTGGEGVYEFYSIARDAALNMEAAPGVPDATTMVDWTAPTSLVDPLPAYETTAVFPVTVTASDTSSGVSEVDLFYYGVGMLWVNLGTDSQAPFNWTFDSWLTGGDGFYEFYSVARDNASNQETAPISPDTSTLVDTTGPTSMVIALQANESASFLVEANANDATSGLQQVGLFYSRNGGNWTSFGTDASSPWNWNFNTASTGGDGFYEFYSIATDISGNLEPTPVLPDTATTVDTTDPISSADALPQYETSSSFIITATASDATSGLYSVDLYFRKDGGTWTKYQTDIAPPWEWTFNTLASGNDGFYEFQTIATDHSGNVESTPSSADVSVTVDTTQPTSSVDALPEYETEETFTITAIADDATGIEEVELWFKKNGGPWAVHGVVTLPPWTWEFNTSGTGGDGEYEFYTRALDIVGNHEDELAWADTTTIVDTVTPALNITSPREGEWLTQSSIDVMWTGADGGSGIDFYEIKLDNDIWINVGTAPNRLYPNVMDGTHNATVRIHDKAGNMQEASIGFGVDSTIPVLTILDPDDGSTVTSSTITVSWTGSDAASGIDRYEVKINGRSFTDMGLETSRRFDGVGDGSHTIILRAYDTAGNFAEAKADVQVDTNPLSPGGPFMGVPLYLIIAAIAGILILFYLRKRKGEDETPDSGPEDNLDN